jgi:hypothetical protein
MVTLHHCLERDGVAERSKAARWAPAASVFAIIPEQHILKTVQHRPMAPSMSGWAGGGRRTGHACLAFVAAHRRSRA